MDVMQHTAREYRRRISLAMNYISAHLDCDLTLEAIAREAAFSSFHFHRIFKAVTGETVSEFTRRLRLEQAAGRLLSHDGASITSIACASGFSSSQNLAKAFRQHFGMSPTEYRKSKTGNIFRKNEDALSLRIAQPCRQETRDPERRNGMNAEIKELPDYNVAFVRKLGPYGKDTAQAAFGELMQWAGQKGFLQTGTMLGLYWDNPEITPPDKCRTDACITVPPGTAHDRHVGIQRIQGGPHAVCHFAVDIDGFQRAWDDAFAWVVAGGYECDDRPCFELYHGGPGPDGKWSVDICIPLRRG